MTRASAERLHALVAGLPHPVALAGGHAVLHTVQERWRARFGQDYFGSRDIDVIYHVDPKWTDEQVRRSAAALAPKRIMALGYKPISFRYVQILDENGRILDKEPTFGIEDVSVYHLYIDPMVTHPHPELSKVWGTETIIDEPLLTEVFQNENARRLLPEFGDNVYLPLPPYLVATKLHSLTTRTKDDKAVKDLCDLYALVAYGGSTSLEIRRLIHFALPDVAERVRFALGSPHLSKALEHLDLAKADFDAVIGPLSLRP
ncbi:MAG: nucleotidyl transferase AbiEii/AbiGii toxin family protein [Candidatus Thermoplasmatota archaeon]